jgi:hypothetical protein
MELKPEGARRTKDFLSRIVGLALTFVALIGVFEPGTLETLFWLHLEVVVLASLLVVSSFVARSGGALVMQLFIAAIAAPFIAVLALGSWLLASLLFSGGGPAATGEPLMAATTILLDEGLFHGLEAFAQAVGPGAGWLVAGSALFHVVVTVARHVFGRMALARRDPPLEPEARAAAEDALQPSALLLSRAFFQAGGLFVASLLTVVPVALAVVSLDDRAPWPSWLVIVGVRLGLEVWRVVMDHSDPEWVREKRRLKRDGQR